MLDEYKFGKDGDKEVIHFMTENQDILREILRMVPKIADPKMDLQLAEIPNYLYVGAI